MQSKEQSIQNAKKYVEKVMSNNPNENKEKQEETKEVFDIMIYNFNRSNKSKDLKEFLVGLIGNLSFPQENKVLLVKYLYEENKEICKNVLKNIGLEQSLLLIKKLSTEQNENIDLQTFIFDFNTEKDKIQIITLIKDNDLLKKNFIEKCEFDSILNFIEEKGNNKKTKETIAINF